MSRSETFYLETVETAVLAGFRAEMKNPKVLAEYVKTYHEERKRLSAESDEDVARQLARFWSATVAVTGAIDFVSDGTRSARVSGGPPLMAKVTALGCSLSALIGAFAAVAPKQPFEATVAALATFAAAGEIAKSGAGSPGHFAVRFLDALHGLASDSLEAKGRITAA